MDVKTNPFHELYFTDSIDSNEFVRLFSDVLIKPSLPLFKPGNVVLKGLPGSGKTMMLNLLKPSIRLAYKRANITFPVPKQFSKFIGSGINLIRSSISDFGQRPIDQNKKTDLNELSIYFGDFLNYWIVRDILDSIQELGESMSDEIGINLSEKTTRNFVESLSNDDCWFGYLEKTKNLSELKHKLRARTNTYRSFLNFNIEELPVEIKESKTSIGMPIINTVQKLRESGVIDYDVQVFVRIDQYEELTWLDFSFPEMGSTFQSAIHKLLAMRDSTVSFRIGTRPFDWQQGSQQILGTSAQLESQRNYIEVSIDEVLRRSESQVGYIFPKFAEDIFNRRLQTFLPSSNVESKPQLLNEVFGDGFSATEKAKEIAKGSRERIISARPTWPESWTSFLKNLANEDPMSAKLAEAWALQKNKSSIMDEVPINHPYPWEEKKYWVKERTDQALLQIASRTRQGIIWYGRDDIFNLSGGNILSFLSLCQHIWEVWMRDSRHVKVRSDLPELDHYIQTLGVLEASRKWFENIGSASAGKEIRLFILFIGSLFYRNLTDDERMSYPGWNGFSVVIEELESNPKIDKFLKDAADRGYLVFRQHTPKNKGNVRSKWYLNPILSPYFKIPAIHTKEPMYITIQTLDEWLTKSKAFEFSTFTKTKRSERKDPGQQTLF